MKDLLIPVDEAAIDMLIEEHQPPGLFQFASDEGEIRAREIYSSLHRPQLDVFTAWAVFRDMLAAL